MFAPPADLLAPTAPVHDPLLAPPADALLAPPSDALLSPPAGCSEEAHLCYRSISTCYSCGDDFVAQEQKFANPRMLTMCQVTSLRVLFMKLQLLTSEGEIIKQDVKGVLLKPFRIRIYDIDVMLNNTVITDLAGDHVQVDELESRKNSQPSTR